jgi:hypothetical protein
VASKWLLKSPGTSTLVSLVLTTSRYLKNVLPASSLKISTGTMVYNIDNRLLIRAMDIGRNLFHCFWIKMWIVSKQGKNFADPIWDLSYCSCLYYQHLRYFSLFFLLGLKSPSSNPMLIGHPVFWSLIDVVWIALFSCSSQAFIKYQKKVLRER